MGGIAAAAMLLTAAPATAQVGFHPDRGTAGFDLGTRPAYYYDVKYLHRRHYTYRRSHRYRYYSGYGNGTTPPTLPSWYGQSSYHSGYFPH